MRSDSIARRYAEALLENITDPQALDDVLNELRAVAALFSENDDLRHYLLDPSVSDEDRKGLLTRVFGDKVHAVLMYFLDLLMKKHRLRHLPAIAGAFEVLVEERRGQARIEVTTARPLPEDQSDRLKRTLAGVVGRDCILDKKVDPGVIAGVVAVYGDRVFDGTIRTELAQLRKQLMEAPI